MPRRKKNDSPLVLDLTSLIGRLTLLVLLLALFSLYFSLNHNWGPVHILETPLDGYIPLVSAMVIPYVLFFFSWGSLLIIYTLIFKPVIFIRIVASFVIGCLIAYILYIIFQTTVPRPIIEPTNIFTQILDWLYSTDHRFNAFPSGHTLSTTILFFSTIPLVRNPWKIFFALIALSIIASTLLLKQHFVPDIFAGLLIGWVSWKYGQKLARRFYSSKKPAINIIT
ncbi:MAG: phosphatase PAP2 family protein [bacterium]